MHKIPHFKGLGTAIIFENFEKKNHQILTYVGTWFLFATTLFCIFLCLVQVIIIQCTYSNTYYVLCNMPDKKPGIEKQLIGRSYKEVYHIKVLECYEQ